MDAMNDTAPRTSGLAFAAGLVLMIVGIVVHPPESYDAATAQGIVASHAGAWRAAHALLATGVAAIALGGAVSANGAKGARRFAWTLLAASGLVATVGFVVEATASPSAAASGDAAAFQAWGAFSAGLLVAMAPFSGAVAVLAGVETTSRERALPRWATIAGLVFASVGAIGALGDALKLPAVAAVLPAAFGGLLYLAAHGVRAGFARRAKETNAAAM